MTTLWLMAGTSPPRRWNTILPIVNGVAIIVINQQTFLEIVVVVIIVFGVIVLIFVNLPVLVFVFIIAALLISLILPVLVFVAIIAGIIILPFSIVTRIYDFLDSGINGEGIV
jgi:hypothetical protein